MKFLNEIIFLCRCEPAGQAGWIEKPDSAKVLRCVIWIIIFSGIYGASVGLWRSPLQAFYVSVKFPMLILLTSSGNALINGMFSYLLGAGITFRQSFLSVLLSFAIASLILGSLTPLSLFLIYNSPAMDSSNAAVAHNIIILSDVLFIAIAGTAANIRLYKMMEHITSSGKKGYLILFSWLSVNLLLGGQLSWIMRPFIGIQGAEVQFMRPNAFDGNFFEAVFGSLGQLIDN